MVNDYLRIIELRKKVITYSALYKQSQGQNIGRWNMFRIDLGDDI